MRRLTCPPLCLAALVAFGVGAGCASTPAGSAGEVPLRPNVTDVRPTARPVVLVDAEAPVEFAQPAALVVPAARRPAPPSPANTHTVRRGETLFAIAKHVYGDGAQWKRLLAANPRVAAAPLRVGQMLVVP